MKKWIVILTPVVLVVAGVACAEGEEQVSPTPMAAIGTSETPLVTPQPSPTLTATPSDHTETPMAAIGTSETRLVTPQPSPTLTPTPSAHTELEIIGHDGKSAILSNPSISYPGGYGPSKETEGIRLRRGIEQATLLWSEVRTLRFRSRQEEKDEGTIIWRHFVEVTLSNGRVTEAELVEDWNMAYMGGGGTGRLFGQGELGETKIQFSDISVIKVLKYATPEKT